MNCEGLEKVIIGDDLKRFFQVGARLPLQERQKPFFLDIPLLMVFGDNLGRRPGNSSEDGLLSHLPIDLSSV